MKKRHVAALLMLVIAASGCTSHNANNDFDIQNVSNIHWESGKLHYTVVDSDGVEYNSSVSPQDPLYTEIVESLENDFNRTVPDKEQEINEEWENYSVDNKAEIYTVDSVVEIDNWSSLLEVRDSYIYGKNAKAKFRVEPYSYNNSIKDCSLKPVKVTFLPSNEDYEKTNTEVSWSQQLDYYQGLCNGDYLTVTHTADNFHPHPKGLMRVQFKYKENIQVNNKSSEVRIHQGKFNIIYSGDSQ